MSNVNARSFIDNWLSSGKKERSATSRQSIVNDSFDKEEIDSLMDQMGDLDAAKQRLGKFAPTSGVSLFGDDFFSLFKALPKMEDPKNMRASHMINRAIMEEAMGLVEYDKLHGYSVADGISAALSAISMEPHLEEIMDRLKTEQEKSEELEQQMQEYESLEDALDDLDPDGDPKDMQANKSLIEQQMKMLESDMQGNADAIDSGLDSNTPGIATSLKSGMNEALEGADAAENAAAAWGLSPGGLKHLPPDERLRLAEKLSSEKFKRIAELFGPMNRLAFAEQSRKSYHAVDEIFDVEQGNDIRRTLVSQLASLTHPALRIDFLRKFIDKRILQYKLRGTEKVAKGGIIFCLDNSGSMNGAREIWGKATGLCLLRIATQQKREFYGIHFGGTKEVKEYDFRGSGLTGSITTKYRGKEESMSYLDGVIDYAETFFGSGTEYITPLSLGLDILKEQYAKAGSVSGDIVFCTDGMCGVSDEWLEAFKAEQNRIGFRVWGIAIGCPAGSEPLSTICDGRVFSIKNLVDGDDLREIFRNL